MDSSQCRQREGRCWKQKAQDPLTHQLARGFALVEKFCVAYVDGQEDALLLAYHRWGGTSCLLNTAGGAPPRV